MCTNIIWDFDGVIADSEMVWLENKRLLLNQKFNLNWDLQTTYNHIGGMSDATKQKALKEIGIETDADFWQESLAMDYNSVKNGEMILTKNIKEVLKEFKGRQCVATGGLFAKTKTKVNKLGIEEFLPDEVLFCADLVKYGKPEPDIFLLAQEAMGWDKKDCVIVEDSVVGMIAGKKAGIRTILFTGNFLYDKEKYINEAKNIGITDFFDDMLELKEFLNNYSL